MVYDILKYDVSALYLSFLFFLRTLQLIIFDKYARISLNSFRKFLYWLYLNELLSIQISNILYFFPKYLKNWVKVAKLCKSKTASLKSNIKVSEFWLIE